MPPGLDVALGDHVNAASAAARCGLGHPREQRVDVDRGAHARRAGDDHVAHALDHARRLDVERLQVGHRAMIGSAGASDAISGCLI